MQLTKQSLVQLLRVLLSAEMSQARLIYGLEKAGLVVDDFHVGLMPSVFMLLGYPEPQVSEQLFDAYQQQLEEACQLSVAEFMARRTELASTMLAELQSISEQ